MADAPETPKEPTAPAGDVQAELDRTRAALKNANKEAETARLRLKEIDDAGKSETERMAAELAAERARADAAEASLVRLEVASEKGLTPAQARRLVGATRDELVADADELLSTFGPAPKTEGDDSGPTAPPAGTPRPDPVGRPKAQLLGGGDPAAPEPSIREVIEALPRT